jgi:hypothetical protein
MIYQGKDVACSLHMLFIQQKLQKFTSWQAMFSPHPEESTPAFYAEAPEAESVN